MSAMLESNERALKISSWLTGVYFVIELGLGISSGSVAVISASRASSRSIPFWASRSGWSSCGLPG